MIQWQLPINCGNAPKQQWLLEWLQAWGNQQSMEEYFTEDTILLINGATTSISSYDMPPLDSVHIQTVLTHGREGAVRGTAKSEQKEYAFSIFSRFTLSKSAKLVEVHVLYAQIC